MDSSINLLVFETWFCDKKNPPLADIVSKQDIANNDRVSLHKITNGTSTYILETNQEVAYSSVLESKGSINLIVENSSEKGEKYEMEGLKCWLCRENHRLKD